MNYTRLRDLREERDIPQKAIALHLHCDQSLYSKYELGKRIIPLEVMERLADFYDTSIDYITGRTDVRAPYPKSRQYN